VDLDYKNPVALYLTNTSSNRFLFIFFLYCSDGRGYTITFTQVLTLYQIYHLLIHLLNNSPSSTTSSIPGVVSTVIFPFTYMYAHFTVLYAASYPLSPSSPCSGASHPPMQQPPLHPWGRTVSPSCFLIL
jgi:hypothetical protein